MPKITTRVTSIELEADETIEIKVLTENGEEYSREVRVSGNGLIVVEDFQADTLQTLQLW